ncbi:YdiY family protein [Halomonas beimenensis]|uniref:Salt-induced outer membrane protein n=1 Tax=Halomonas beimenensis TaxID=475662 RepID=A0A291PB75_9GAMM|nr:DUF481 domain-containing protein [Halomonas beimenensis]ATJ84157.1 protein of unknown function DUF481 [Halomonas beimenensis]
MPSSSLPTHALWLGLVVMLDVAQATPFYAPPAPQADTPDWSGEAELGFTRLTGNTDSQTLLAKGRLTWLSGDLVHSLSGQARQVTRDGETSSERYRLALRERHDIEGPHYLFGFARWDKDRFGGYDYQLAAIAGYGRRLLDAAPHRLALEAGPGYRHDSVGAGADRRLGVLYAALDYRGSLAENATVTQELSLEQTDANLTARTLSALSAHLNDHLALRISHEIEHNSRPPADAAALTDHTTGVSLLYDW